jgi:hypothetical protein
VIFSDPRSLNIYGAEFDKPKHKDVLTQLAFMIPALPPVESSPPAKDIVVPVQIPYAPLSWGLNAMQKVELTHCTLSYDRPLLEMADHVVPSHLSTLSAPNGPTAKQKARLAQLTLEKPRLVSPGGAA